MIKKLFVTCIAAAISAAAHAASEKLPNNVIIFTDDQGYADAGKFGTEGFVTPIVQPLDGLLPT
jgi:arylsulfatase A